MIKAAVASPGTQGSRSNNAGLKSARMMSYSTGRRSVTGNRCTTWATLRRTSRSSRVNCSSRSATTRADTWSLSGRGGDTAQFPLCRDEPTKTGTGEEGIGRYQARGFLQHVEMAVTIYATYAAPQIGVTTVCINRYSPLGCIEGRAEHHGSQN